MSWGWLVPSFSLPLRETEAQGSHQSFPCHYARPSQVRLRDPKEWGGGLEIVALANALERPIFLYELKPVGLLFWSR